MSLYLNKTGTKLVKKAANNSLTSSSRNLALKQVISLGLYKLSELKQQTDDKNDLQLPPADIPLLLSEEELATVELVPELREDENFTKTTQNQSNLFQ